MNSDVINHYNYNYYIIIIRYICICMYVYMFLCVVSLINIEEIIVTNNSVAL